MSSKKVQKGKGVIGAKNVSVLKFFKKVTVQKVQKIKRAKSAKNELKKVPKR